MRVKALREHTNSYGEKPHKGKDAEYDVPDAAASALIQAKFVEEVKAEEKPAAKAK